VRVGPNFRNGPREKNAVSPQKISPKGRPLTGAINQKEFSEKAYILTVARREQRELLLKWHIEKKEDAQRPFRGEKRGLIVEKTFPRGLTE